MTILRHFRAEDAELLRARLYPELESERIGALIEEWGTLKYGGKYFEMFAVEEDGRVVGSASLYEHSPSVVSAGNELFGGERGKGLGTAAMRLLEEAAAGRGFRIIKDQVAADNAGSIGLHEKCGFETDGYVYKNKKGVDVLIFLKAL